MLFDSEDPQDMCLHRKMMRAEDMLRSIDNIKEYLKIRIKRSEDENEIKVLKQFKIELFENLLSFDTEELF